MFLEHFGMHTAPFERGAASNALFESSQFSEGLARLLYSCQRRTLALVTGEVGTGKSTMLRFLRHKLDPNNYFFIYIADSNLSPRNFYTLAVSMLGVEPRTQLPKLKQQFKSITMDLYEGKGQSCVIAIDEAQTLELSMLQELRFIMNFKTDSFSPLSLILSGQAELRSTLRTLHMAAIWRRIDTNYHITGLDLAEAKAYITHQLSVSGCSRPLFPEDVVNRIHERAKGIPATLNTLCKGCLLDAASRKQDLVDAENLNRVLVEFT
mgnify:CR=1 FL=1